MKAKIPVIDEALNTEVLEDVEDEKMKNLESELEIERNNANINAEKLLMIKKDYALLQEKQELLERENESLLEKIIKMEVNETTKESPVSIVSSSLLQKIAKITTDIEVKNLIESQVTAESDPETSHLIKELQENYEQEKEKRKKAEEQLLRNEKDVKKKLTSLENNIQQLTSVYHDLYVEQSKWKIENTINL